MTDALEELESLLPELPQAKERRTLGESLARVASLLKDITLAAHRLSDTYDIAEMIGFGDVPEAAEKISDMSDIARHLASLLEGANDATTLHQIERDFPELKAAIGAAFSAMKQRWRTEVAAEYRPFLSLGQLLAKIDHDSTLGARMVKLGEDANTSLNVTQTDQFKQVVANLIDTRARLESEKTSFTSDEEVDNFLSALAQNQAKLGSVTPDILRWLSEHDALDLFEVRPIG